MARSSTLQTTVVYRGDHGDVLNDTLKSGGSAVDLTNASAVWLHIQNATASKSQSFQGAIVSAEDGTVKYTTTASDFDSASDVDDYIAEWEVLWNDGTRSTFPSSTKLTVKQDIADASA